MRAFGIITLMFLAGTAIFGVITGPAVGKQKSTVDQKIILRVRATIFFKDAKKRFVTAIWDHEPGQVMLNKAYRVVPRGIYGGLSCAVSRKRTLIDCRPVGMDDPPDPRAIPSLLALSKSFRLAGSSPQSAEIDWISLDMWLTRGDRPGYCPSLFCTFTPPPPLQDQDAR